jgi:hypothetical protein
MCLDFKYGTRLRFLVVMTNPYQGPTPKNDFCRIFSRSSILYPLSLVLNKVLDEQSELAELIEGRIVNIFYIFSQAENYVKEIIADRKVLWSTLFYFSYNSGYC